MKSVLQVLVAVAPMFMTGCERATAPAPSRGFEHEAKSVGAPALGVSLETDRQVYESLIRGDCERAIALLETFPEPSRDIQWFMRAGDSEMCIYRRNQTKDGRERVLSRYDAGLKLHPRSARLILEKGVAYLNFNALQDARRLFVESREQARRNITDHLPADGMDDDGAIVKQAEDWLKRTAPQE